MLKSKRPPLKKRTRAVSLFHRSAALMLLAPAVATTLPPPCIRRHQAIRLLFNSIKGIISGLLKFFILPSFTPYIPLPALYLLLWLVFLPSALSIEILSYGHHNLFSPSMPLSLTQKTDVIYVGTKVRKFPLPVMDMPVRILGSVRVLAHARTGTGICI